jgi:broad specificity phosphatase PhoE
MQPQIALFCARHGETTLNKLHVFRGDKDPPLDAKGFRGANELAFYFQPIELSFIVCSDKQRTQSTADIIYLAKKTNLDEPNPIDLKPYPNEFLRPWNVGDFGGKPKNKENIEKLQRYVDNPDIPVPGGTSLNEFRARVRPLFMEAVEVGINTGVPGLLVIHSSLIHEIGTTFGTSHEDANVKPGGVVAVYTTDSTDSGFMVKAIFKPDTEATTQNILGVGGREEKPFEPSD